MVELIKQAGGYDINYACIIDLTFLEGTAKLKDYCGVETFSVMDINE
jgi:adenine/guanine phosphoribosyltransferase-like PRPP-binding protein